MTQAASGSGGVWGVAYHSAAPERGEQTSPANQGRITNRETRAEGAGFEPALQGYRKAVFKTAAFVRSATPPRLGHAMVKDAHSVLEREGTGSS